MAEKEDFGASQPKSHEGQRHARFRGPAWGSQAMLEAGVPATMTWLPWSTKLLLTSAGRAEVPPWNVILQPCVEIAMENAVKFLVKFCCSSFLRKRSSKVPRDFHDNFTPLFTRRFADANAQFQGIFHSADVCPWYCVNNSQRNNWEPVGHLQGSLGPSRPERPEKVWKKSPGASGPSPPRESGKSLEGLEKVSKVPKRHFWELFQTLGGPWGLRPRETFSRLFRGFGPGGPERPLQMANGLPRE